MAVEFKKYVLDGRTPRPEPNRSQWLAFMETAQRHVADDTIGGVRVSTIFLGMNHGVIFGPGPHVPILFETLIFGGEHDQYQEQYATWEEAEAGHARALLLVRGDPKGG